MNRVVSSLLLASLALAIINPIRGQQQSQPQQPAADDIVRISTNLVQVDAVVTDKNGNPIKDLTAADFEVFQDGKPQKVVSLTYVSTEQTESQPVATQPVNVDKVDKKAPLAPPTRMRVANAGRVLTFIVDDGSCSTSQLGMQSAKDGLEKFIVEQMRPDDLVAIYQTRSGSSMLQQFTSNKSDLMRVVRKIRWYPPRGACANEGTGDFYDPARVTTGLKSQARPVDFESARDRANKNQVENRLRDNQVVGLIGVLRYITRGLQKVPGRKTVFLLSDGIPLFNLDAESRGAPGSPGMTTSRVSDAAGVMNDLIDSANRASVVFNTIDVRGVTIPGAISAQDDFDNIVGRGGTGDVHATSRVSESREASAQSLQSGMNYLAEQTGGRFYHDSNNLSIPMKRALNLEKGYYLIGYQPDEDTFKGKRFNRIEVKVKRPELSVRSRSGFLGITDEALRPKKRSGDSELYEAIVAPLPKAGLNLHLTAFFGNTEQGGSFVRTLLHLDGEQISFVDEPNGMKKAVFDVVAVTLNEKNEVVDEFNRTHTIRFPGAYADEINRKGLIYNADIPVKKPGVYNFRVAIRDQGSKLLGSAGQQIEVPDLKKHNLLLTGLTVGEVELKGGKPIMPSIEKTESGFSAVVSVSDPAIRRFQPGAIVGYAYKILNADLDKATRQPNVTVQVRLFRDGKVFLDGGTQPGKFEPQADMTRISDYGYLRLQPEAPAGDYALQVVVRDTKSNETTSQWIDFEVVK